MPQEKMCSSQLRTETRQGMGQVQAGPQTASEEASRAPGVIGPWVCLRKQELPVMVGVWHRRLSPFRVAAATWKADVPTTGTRATARSQPSYGELQAKDSHWRGVAYIAR